MKSSARTPFGSVRAIADQFDLETLAWAVDQAAEPDFRFYESVLCRTPGLALDAGCGTGRLLVALLCSKFTVEGCDISPAMLALCRRNAEALGFDPVLYLRAVQELPFTDRYAAIFLACGTFMCITDSEEADHCLVVLHHNLRPGGRLVLSIMPPTYLRLAGGPFPTPWEPYYQLTLPDAAGILVVDWRATQICMAEQTISEECRYRWVMQGSIIREEISPGEHRWYQRDQLLARLHGAGFRDIDVHTNYSLVPSLTEPDGVLSFVATR